ncbi:eCIS core domain-containing protein [Nitrospira sp. NS4]|uniref:eCIS core domain-containing protein n=1 Tax=Nitrospira sp. NS4 TaxID=3414498 RepID=UPI003C308B86
MPAALATKPEEKRRGRLETQSIAVSTLDAGQGLGASAGLPLFLQPKLAISQPGDPYEQEADRVADQILRMPEPTVQRQCAACSAGGPPCQACGEERISLSRKPDGVAGGDAPGSVQSVIRSPGQPLAPAIRTFFEPRFGQDLSHVRVHTDEEAQRSARDVNALAYTVGSHVVFGAGRYNPGSSEGRLLLAHELAHVSQQSTIILPYRDPKSPQTFNFGAADTVGLVEDSFTLKKDKETKPWIELITVTFAAKSTDSDGEEYWVGSGVAQYYNNAAKLPDIGLNLSGGPVGGGKTKSGTFTVKRIEGIGYMSSKYSDEYEPAATKGKGRRYSKDKQGNMNFAVFFYGGQALHSGPVDLSSHGCVHVDWTDETNMQQLNYHSVVGLTKVKVKYS